MVEALTDGGGERVFTVDTVHAAMVSCGYLWSQDTVHAAMVSCGYLWSQDTVAKTMLRMTRPARRPPHLQLDRVGRAWYRVGGCVPSLRLGR